MSDNKPNPLKMSATIVALCLADTEVRENAKKQAAELTKKLNAAAKDAHEALWAKVYEENPSLDKDAGYHLDVKYANEGVVMLTACDHNHDEEMPKGLKDLLEALSK